MWWLVGTDAATTNTRQTRGVPLPVRFPFSPLPGKKGSLNLVVAVLHRQYRCRRKWYFYTGVSRPDQQYPKKPEKRHAPYGRMLSHGRDKRQVYESYLLASEAGSLMDTKGQVAFNLVKCASDKSHTLILGVYPYTGHETLPDLADAEMDGVRTLKDVIKIVDPVERVAAIKKYLKDTYGIELPADIDSFDGVLNISEGGGIGEQE